MVQGRFALRMKTLAACGFVRTAESGVRFNYLNGKAARADRSECRISDESYKDLLRS